MAEILAPAGSPEAVYAAVRSGADAVYLAGEAFNARRGAKNFTPEQLKECVAYCHARGVKVHHALNILVKDSEIADLKAEIERILACGEDALILQDLGVAKIVKALAPDMPLHASTQLSVHSLSGVRALERLGFCRAVLARELSLEEIAYIRTHTAMELEIFVHGALCMCVSGQCYMSAFFGARSGNRGLCAQPCRLPFRAPGGTGHDLSLKDCSVLEYLPALADMGIDSFKIEGRMKRPEYVAASVSAARSALAGEYTQAQSENLKHIFSRQGFTDGYLRGERGRQMFGYRTKENVTAAGDKLLKTYAALYAKEMPRVPCTVQATMRANVPPILTVEALGNAVTVQGETLPEPAMHRALTREEVAARLSKLGGTGFYAKTVHVDIDPGLAMSAGALNQLRREAVARLEALLRTPRQQLSHPHLPALPARREPQAKRLYLRFADIAQAAQFEGAYDKIILPLEQAQAAVERFGTQSLTAEAPRVFFGAEEKLIALLDRAKAAGVEEIAAGNIGALQLAQERGFHTFAGFGTNIFNSYAAAEIGADEILLSPEMSTAQIAALHCEKPFGNLVYGHLPLMITRNCPLKTGTDCAHCDRHGSVTDRKGERFPVRCRFGASEIFNPHALYMIDKEAEISGDFSLLYFTTESPEAVRHILELYRTHGKADFPFTRGLYGKGVL